MTSAGSKAGSDRLLGVIVVVAGVDEVAVAILSVANVNVADDCHTDNNHVL